MTLQNYKIILTQARNEEIISRKMKIAMWSLQNQVSQNCIIPPTDYTDIARIGFAPKLVAKQPNTKLFYWQEGQ